MIVQTITSQKTGATVHIDDSILRGLSPSGIADNRRNAGLVAGRIAARAMERGAVEGMTPEAWAELYGRDPYGNN